LEAARILAVAFSNFGFFCIADPVAHASLPYLIATILSLRIVLATIPIGVIAQRLVGMIDATAFDSPFTFEGF
jgi:hypothetical protein